MVIKLPKGQEYLPIDQRIPEDGTEVQINESNKTLQNEIVHPVKR